MSTNVYIADCTNQILGEQLQRCCVLADMQIPETPALVVTFLRDHFGRYPYPILSNAIDNFVAGNCSVKRPMKMNAHFMSLILKEFIELHRHNIIVKPKTFLALPPKIETEEEKMDQRKKTYELCYSNFIGAYENNSNALIIYIMELIGSNHLDYKVTPTDKENTQYWVCQYDARRDKDFIDQRRSIGKLVNVVVATKQPVRNWDKIAVVYTHFIKRLKNNEEPWY